jgi:hypothetical protein
MTWFYRAFMSLSEAWAVCSVYFGRGAAAVDVLLPLYACTESAIIQNGIYSTAIRPSMFISPSSANPPIPVSSGCLHLH